MCIPYACCLCVWRSSRDRTTDTRRPHQPNGNLVFAGAGGHIRQAVTLSWTTVEPPATVRRTRRKLRAPLYLFCATTSAHNLQPQSAASRYSAGCPVIMQSLRLPGLQHPQPATNAVNDELFPGTSAVADAAALPTVSAVSVRPGRCSRKTTCAVDSVGHRHRRSRRDGISIVLMTIWSTIAGAMHGMPV